MPTKSGTSSSSMHTASSFTSSWIGTSPSRQSPSRSSHTRNGSRTTPRRDAARRSTLDRDPFDSPARQMLLDFSQMLIRSDQEFNDRLDLDAAQHAKLHNEQIAKASLEHAKVREGAEREWQRLLLEQELARRKREEEQLKEVQRLEQEKAKKEAEALQRELEAKQREEEAARRVAEQQRKIHEAEARIKAQKEQEEAAQKQKLAQEAAAREAQQAAVAAEKARIQAVAQQKVTAQLQTPAAPSAPAPVAPTVAASTQAASQPVSAQVEELHAKYLDLHKRMKDFWKPFKKQCAVPGNPLKGPVGDMRRDIRKAIGQVTTKRDDSRAVIKKIRDVITAARNAGGPTLDIRPFLISQQLPQLSNEAEAQYPQLMLYAYICIEKQVLKQFEQEAANEDGRIISELGAIVASLLIDKNYVWREVPMTDLILAKMHRVCPILFGIRGNMSTAAGQARLGWINIAGAPPEVNSYNQRMLGLGAGFAALSLRHVPQPAVPMSEYWRAVAAISNTPAGDLFGGHFMVMKGLLRDNAKKFVNFYGVAAVALLRKATFTLPARAPPNTKDAANLVQVLPDVWKVSMGLSLA
ncbi:hypothetical protein BU24DRAFT_103827 [Aaosphaeria arxii CBS 175.79]|uniref:mRNA export factor GLE1 n=1 Tax=Aaosphaeria arxii CBS 175.79 TaxID=1450172 RepID=A0A6A5Y1D5_9PLEO|nr:uncharacterized protein BU24DRAFT_103827 [Aaosphaeria arxii CBS 175.79]KAF2018731.1 hypothetical protein BU24DRAFT_103827 [Aaosphaeria arxii CBS 175.79]